MDWIGLREGAKSRGGAISQIVDKMHEVEEMQKRVLPVQKVSGISG